jgi:hypothetical protein
MAAVPASEAAPDFNALFPLADTDDAQWRPAARTASLLFTALNVLADFVQADIERHGARPVGGDDFWYALDRLPSVTWHQRTAWRRRIATSARALAADLADGRQPIPRCTAEEMILHLAIEDAEGDDGDPLAAPEYPWATVAGPDDEEWEACRDLLFDDHDVLMLDEPAPDGIEELHGDTSISGRTGALRPEAWFDTFRNFEPR